MYNKILEDIRLHIINKTIQTMVKGLLRGI